MNTEQDLPMPEEDVTPEDQLEDEQIDVDLVEQEDAEIVAEKKRMPRWLKIGLIGLGTVIVLFFAGFLTDHFTRFLPLQRSFEMKSKQVEDLENQVSSLTDELNKANDKITGLNSEIAGLQSNLDEVSIHLELLSAIRELQAAQIFLENDDISGAKVALRSTPDRLENLKAVIAPLDATLADNISDRMIMILSDLDQNQFMAKSNIALLISNLENIEILLYP